MNTSTHTSTPLDVSELNDQKILDQTKNMFNALVFVISTITLVFLLLLLQKISAL